jgi:para-nitrobenzyl esterase
VVFVLAFASMVACSKDESDNKGAPPQDGAISADGATPADAATKQDGASGDDLIVTLDDGQIQGDIVGGSRRFLKIPYAKPPVGTLRWKAPVNNDKWTGVRHEADFSDGCPQNASSGAAASKNEDCLYLNVWAPEPAPEKAAVMVWIHGGGNFSGSSRDTVSRTDPPRRWFDGQFFASKQGVVVVTLNYRLGPLGFFAHPALPAEGSPLGNQGLLDQRMALQWVKNNIAKFGGDPGNVTIFGESAGSSDVCYHVASPGSRGLFHRAISESGGCTGRFGLQANASGATQLINTFAKELGCDTATDQLSCLRGKSIDDVLANAHQPNPTSGSGDSGFSFAVVVDGAGGFLPAEPRALFDQGDIAQVPYLLGSNTDEGTLFTYAATPVTTEADYKAALLTRFGAAFADQVAAVYPASKYDGKYQSALTRAVGDSMLGCGTHDSARRAAKAGRKVFMYNFNIPWTISEILGAAHASEISHVFGNPVNADAASQAVSDAMNTYWATFAKTGDPNYAGAPATWPQFTPDANDNDKRLQLDSGWAILDNFRKEECTLWRKYYDSQAQ